MSLVLVTGGAGFIGSHLTELLLARGYRVRVIDSLVYGRREWVPEAAEFIQGDICCQDAVAKAFEGNVVGVFHAAAMSRSGPSLEAVDICTNSNVIGTLNVLKGAREAGVRKLVYSGSSTYYGSQPLPHSVGKTQSEFLNFYALTKYVGEEYALIYDRLHDVPSIVLRYFSVYGPRQPEVGPYALVMGTFLKRWATGQALEIHGDGKQRRDFIHVRDVAMANLLAFESDQRACVLNVGSGANTSIQELADMISLFQTRTEARRGDSLGTLADIRETFERIGWRPSISIAEGLEEVRLLMSRARDLSSC